MEKLDEIKRKIESIQNKSAVSQEMRAFMTLVLSVVAKAKEDFKSISKENLNTIQEAVNYIDSEHTKLINNVTSKTSNQTKNFESKVKELNRLIEEVKSIELKDGKDGNDGYTPIKGEDYFTEKEIKDIKDNILKDIPETDGEEIVNKINELEITPLKQIDFKHIKNAPDFKGFKGGSTARNLYQLLDVNLTDVADNDILQYDTSNNTWKNVTPQSSEDVEIGDIIGSATAGSVFFAGAGGALAQDNANLFWDDTNNRLGIGTASPVDKLQILNGNIVLSNNYGIKQYSSGGTLKNLLRFTPTDNLEIGPSVAGSDTYIYGGDGTSNRFIVIKSTGDVGINLATPAYKLDVNGTLGVRGVITQRSAAGYLKSLNAAADNHVIQYFQAASYSWDIGTTPKMIMTTTGNLGIGVSPTEALHVYRNTTSDGAVTRMIIENTGSTGYTGSDILLKTANNTRGAGVYTFNGTGADTWFAGVPYSFAGYGIGYKTGASFDVTAAESPALKFVVLEGGNVGIGTTAPGAALEISNANNVPFIINSSGNVPGIQIKDAGVLKWVIAERATNNGNLFFSASPADTSGTSIAAAAKLTIQQDGNVGIGTTTPNAKLSFGTSSNGDKIHIYDDGTYVAGFGVQSLETLRIFGDSFNKKITFGSQTRAGVFSEYMRIDSGNVGIGTTAPGEKLDVVGDGQFTGEIGLGNNKGLIIKTSGGTYRDIIKLNASNVIEIGSSALSTNILFQSSGNVGIGSSSPTTKLEVVDNGASGVVVMNVRQDDNFPYGLAVNNDAYSTTNTHGLRLYVYNAGVNSLAQIYAPDNGVNAAGIQFLTDNSARMTINSTGYVGIGTTSPTAVLHLKAGTATASTAPLKFTSGTLLTAAEAGAVEFLTDAYYGTITTGAARKTFAFLESPVFTTPTLGVAIATSLDIGNADTTISRVSAGVIAVEGVTIPTVSSTSTLTNKRVTKRVITTTDDATAVIDVDVTDVYELSAVANATEFTVTGTPTDGQKLIVRYKDAGVTKNLTWTFATAIGITLPAATTAGKWGYVGCIYNSAASQWHAVAVSTQA